MDLFLTTPKLSFQKQASCALDEDSRHWTQQILAEAYRACPAIADFSSTITFREKDDEQGYALGAVVVEASVNSALAATRVGAARPGRVAIPVIIRNYELLPLDVFMDASGRAMPLTESRLREALFTPDVGDSVTNDLGDTSIYNLLYPLGRASSGDFGMGMGLSTTNGNISTVMGTGMKFSAAMGDPQYSLLDELAVTMRVPDIAVVEAALQEDGVKVAVANNEPFREALSVIAAAAPSALSTADGLVKAAQAMARADVIQIGHDDVGYWMRTAASNAYSTPETYALERADLLKIAGPEMTRKVDTEGTVTVAPQQAPEEGSPSADAVVTSAGIYTVPVEGAEAPLTGWVLPNLIGLDGLVMPQAVFTNGAVSMVQDQIVGTRVSTGADLPRDEPKGVGCFYSVNGEDIKATVPINVMGREEVDGLPAWMVQGAEGESTRLRFAPGLQNIEFVDGELFLPENAGFISLNEGASLPLASEPGAPKVASAASSVTVRRDGDTYALTFRGADKLSALVRSRGELDHDDAMFVLALAGVSPPTASTKLASADIVSLPIRDITMFEELVKQSSDETASLAAMISGLRMSLVKEAAALPSSTTVDAVLSLGFINPENVRLFLARLPYLEKSLSMLCEMVVASRLGLTSIPEGAASRGARGVDAVITGLRGLALMEMDQAA